ncbi:MAG: hypothetical protein EZS28_037091, partial [Streblomastix strix]
LSVVAQWVWPPTAPVECLGSTPPAHVLPGTTVLAKIQKNSSQVRPAAKTEGVGSEIRYCLRQIQIYGEEQDQTELVNVGYGRVLSIAFCTAGGVGEEQDAEIWNVLNSIYNFLRQLHEGKTNDQQPSFQPLPLLARKTEEQIEEEGSNEEIEAQMNNNENNGYISVWAKFAKTETLNRFIRRR